MSQPTALIFLNDQDRAAQAANKLSEAGVQATTAANHRQVAALCHDINPALLIVEGPLADKPGLDLVRWLRRGGVTCPALFMCASKVEENSLEEIHELRPFVACQRVSLAVAKYFLSYSQPTTPQLADSGSIENIGLGGLFFYALRTRWTGKLELECQGTIKTIFFQEGQPVYCSSNLFSENFGQMLLRREIITEVEYEWARKIQQREGIRQGEALVKIGRLSHEDLYSYLDDQIREKIVNAFGWPSATYVFHEGKHHLHNVTRFSYNALDLVVSGCKRFLVQKDIQTIWKDYRNSWAVIICDNPEIVTAFVERFGEEVLEAFQNPVSVLHTAVELGWDKLEALAILMTLHTNRVVHLALAPTALPLGVKIDRRSLELPPTEEELTSPSETSSTFELSVVEPDPEMVAMSEKLWQAYLRITSADYFETLNLQHTSEEEEVFIARDALLETYSPMMFKPILEQPKMVKALQEIRTNINQAANTLLNPFDRSAYIKSLKKNQRGTGSAGNYLQAEDEFLAGMSKLPDSPTEASIHFERASQLNTLEPVYTMYHGWSRYLSSSLLSEKQAGRDLVEKALATNPLLDNGYVFMARIFIDIGDTDEAVNQAECALAFNPENAAAREIVEELSDGPWIASPVSFSLDSLSNLEAPSL